MEVCDLVTHLPATDHGHDAIYTVVDRLSKFTYFIPCNTQLMLLTWLSCF